MHTVIVNGYGACPVTRTPAPGRNATSYVVDVAGRTRRVYLTSARGPEYRGNGAPYYVNVNGARVAVYRVPA